MAAADRARPRRRDVSDGIADALASRRALDERLGRPRSCADEVLARVVESRVCGKRLADIASALNADGVPTLAVATDGIRLMSPGCCGRKTPARNSHGAAQRRTSRNDRAPPACDCLENLVAAEVPTTVV